MCTTIYSWFNVFSVFNTSVECTTIYSRWELRVLCQPALHHLCCSLLTASEPTGRSRNDSFFPRIPLKVRRLCGTSQQQGRRVHIRTTQSLSSMRAPPQMQMTPSRLCVPASESDSAVVYRKNDCILILLAPACACGGSSQHVSQETDKTDHACQPCLDVEAQLCATSTAWGQYFSDMFNHV